MKRIEDVRRRLLFDPLAIPSWIYVAPRSAPAVISALDYWPSIIPRRVFSNIKNKERTEQQVAAVVDSLSDADFQAQCIRPSGVPISEAQGFIKKSMVGGFLDQHGVGGDRGLRAFKKEMGWYKEMNCFYPPKELEKRHLGLVAF